MFIHQLLCLTDWRLHLPTHFRPAGYRGTLLSPKRSTLRQLRKQLGRLGVWALPT